VRHGRTDGARWCRTLSASAVYPAKSERAFTEERDGALVAFTFSPGQRCFASDKHRVVLEREPVFMKVHGDWRTSGQMKALEPAQWLDEFAGNQERLSALHEKG